MSEIVFIDGDPRFLAQRLMAILGVKPGDKIVITTPEFERPTGSPNPTEPPSDDINLWNALRSLTVAQLEKIGLGKWDGRLMLFPHEWFAKIPDGLMVEDISGEIFFWKREEMSNDKRFGCLAYGIPATDGVAED